MEFGDIKCFKMQKPKHIATHGHNVLEYIPEMLMTPPSNHRIFPSLNEQFITLSNSLIHFNLLLAKSPQNLSGLLMLSKYCSECSLETCWSCNGYFTEDNVLSIERKRRVSKNLQVGLKRAKADISHIGSQHKSMVSMMN